MADFCQACSLEIFGEDFGELAGLIEEQRVREGMGAAVICEGCGPILVDHLGRCIDPECLKKGESGHGPEQPA